MVRVQVLRAGTVFDGESRRTGVDVLVDGDRVVAVETSGPPPDGAELVDLGPGVTLLPGLVDAHQHLVLDASTDVVATVRAADRDSLLATATRGAQRALSAGVTTVRDLGDRDYVTVELRDRRAGDLPRLLVSGPPVTTRGGHCWFLGGEVEGPDGLAAAVEERVAHGVDVVKVMATGGALTAGTDMGAAQFTAAELAVVVERAHAAGLPVAVHGHGRDGIAAAVEAGVDTVEHFSFMTADGVVADDALIERVAASGPPVVLTPGAVPGQVPPDAIAGRLPLLLATQRRIREAGVPVLIGSDAGIGPGKPHDVLPYSLAMATWVGYPPTTVLAAATSRAAAALGLGREVGVLRPGAAADVLAVTGDPTVDVTALLDVLAVWHDGRRVAGASRRPPAVPPAAFAR